jgi:hypothetical protein
LSSTRFFLWLSVAPAELAESVEGSKGMLAEIMEEAVADPHGIMISDVGSGSPCGGLVLFRDGIILVVSNMFHCQP